MPNNFIIYSMKKTVFVCAFLFVCTLIFGQNSGDTIVLKKVIGGYEVFQSGKVLTMTQLAMAVRSSEAATNELKKASTVNSFGSIFAYLGGALIGYPLGWAIGSGQMNWPMFGIGCGLAAFSIPFSRSVNRRVKSAVEFYNNDQKVPVIQETSEIKVGLVPNGIGLTMTF
jgi:hypothetical protein